MAMKKTDFEFINKKQSNRFIAKRTFSIKKRQEWLLILVFLLGYMLAWGSILVDRQMLIDEHHRLKDEVKQARIELRIATMIDEYNEDYTDQVEWNKKALEEVPSGQVDK